MCPDWSQASTSELAGQASTQAREHPSKQSWQASQASKPSQTSKNKQAGASKQAKASTSKHIVDLVFLCCACRSFVSAVGDRWSLLVFAFFFACFHLLCHGPWACASSICAHTLVCTTYHVSALCVCVRRAFGDVSLNPVRKPQLFRFLGLAPHAYSRLTP